MPTGEDDRFTLHDKAIALAEVATGMSYRAAAQEVRDRAGHLTRRRAGHWEPSLDGRLVMDWVPHYAPILAYRYLPKQWPEVLVVDHLPFHVKARRPDGTPKQSGRVAFHVLAAMSYGDGTVADAEDQSGRRPRLWVVGGEDALREGNWRRFLARLSGQPRYVVCDRQPALVKALSQLWPETRVYPCSFHLYQNVAEDLRKGNLRESALREALNEGTFRKAASYARFLSTLRRFARSPQAEGLTPAQHDAAKKLLRWFKTHHWVISRSIREPHAPYSTGGLEQPLRVIKNALFDRRALFKNLERLDALLVLLQLSYNGLANPKKWADLMRHAHDLRHGKVPGRRGIDRTHRRLP